MKQGHRPPTFVACGLLMLVAAALSASGQTGAPNAITSVRAWTMGEVTRVAIETTAEPRWHGELIQNPDRLFFDISDSAIRLRAGATRVVEVGDRLVSRVRMAMNQPSVARVVIDLHGPAEYEASVLANPYRLVIEIRPVRARPAEPKPVETTATAPPGKQSEPEVERAAPVVLAKPPKAAGVNTVTGQRSLTRALGLKLGRVVIDPGHGGSDLGTTSRTGLHEKDLVLDVARRVGALVEEKLGASVVYTRTDDVFIPLEERTAIANRARADLFLSIHANSSRLRVVAGPETFYLSLTNSKADLEVAARENAANGNSIFELQTLLQQIATQDKVEESSEFAARMQRALFTEVSRGNRTARDRGVKKAPFVVLIGAQMPSILAEIGFLSNPREAALLKRADYRQRIAEALYEGIAQYASTLSQMDVAQQRAATETAGKP